MKDWHVGQKLLARSVMSATAYVRSLFELERTSLDSRSWHTLPKALSSKFALAEMGLLPFLFRKAGGNFFAKAPVGCSRRLSWVRIEFPKSVAVVCSTFYSGSVRVSMTAHRSTAVSFVHVTKVYVGPTAVG